MFSLLQISVMFGDLLFVFLLIRVLGQYNSHGAVLFNITHKHKNIYTFNKEILFYTLTTVIKLLA